MFGSSDLNYWASLQQHTDLLLTSIFAPSPQVQKGIDTLNDYFVSLMTPKEFGNNSNNIIIERVRAFDKVCVLLIKNGYTDPETFAVSRFYSVIKEFKDNANKLSARQK